jgi:trans-2,3-dihydro-3-hydroxyanthranilate isomerase
VRLDYDVVDVFTDRAYAGNPLAVVYGAEKLATAELQAIAREFNLSETTFPVPLTDEDRADGADYRVRIFTPDGEIPFAGHPTLGTAWALRDRRLLAPGQRVQACGAGPIGVEVPADAMGAVELSASPRDPARALSRGERELLAQLVGLEPSDLVGDAHSAGCGLSWLYLQVEADAVDRSRPSARRITETDIELGNVADPLDGVAVYTVETIQDRIDVCARVYVPGYGIPEDPATGSAAAGLGLVLVASGVAAPDGESAYTIRQGIEMGRPSSLYCRVEATGRLATRVYVAGQVVPVATGTLVVPLMS